jgi:acyl carrier protein
MEYVLIIIFIILFVYAFSRYEGVQKNKKIEIAFKDRQSLSPSAFYQKYYGDKNIPEEVVKGVRKILEEQLNADLSQLSSVDDFSENLSFFWDYDSMANVEIVMMLEEFFSIKIEDSEAEKAKTVNDIIMLVSNKIKNA